MWYFDDDDGDEANSETDFDEDKEKPNEPGAIDDEEEDEF
jgi:hypothetical protein